MHRKMEKLELSNPLEHSLEQNANYDIVFIGGGPSTLSFLTYLLKQKKFEKIMSILKILIIEQSNNFGSGCIGKYGVNSNTSAEGFANLICYNTEEKHNIPYLSGENKIKNKTLLSTDKSYKCYLTQFKDLYNSNPCQSLLQYGKKPAPLSLIGNFLDCVGNTIAEYAYRMCNRKILLLNSEVIRILFDSEEKLKDDSKNCNYHCKITVRRHISDAINSKDETIEINTKLVVLASGAKQKFDKTIIKEILNIVNQKDFFHSDYILKEKGYSTLVNNIIDKKSKKIIIIGGSHSGFSCAWILLNSPADYNKLKPKIYVKEYKCKYNNDCNKCITQKCCFGNTLEKNWKETLNLQATDCEIYILYRDHIKVYYSSEQEALSDGYDVYDPKKSVNKKGNVYPFIGLRGDAKKLYKNIVKGNERRVKLVKYKNISDIKNIFKSTAAVIWACGYTTEKLRIEVKSNKNNPKQIIFYQDSNEQYEVDKDLHLMLKDKSPIISMLGIGQGYSTHSIEILNNGHNARADSVNFYHSYIAKKLLLTLEKAFSIKETILNSKQENIIKNNKNSNKKNEMDMHFPISYSLKVIDMLSKNKKQKVLESKEKSNDLQNSSKTRFMNRSVSKNFEEIKVDENIKKDTLHSSHKLIKNSFSNLSVSIEKKMKLSPYNNKQKSIYYYLNAINNQNSFLNNHLKTLKKRETRKSFETPISSTNVKQELDQKHRNTSIKNKVNSNIVGSTGNNTKYVYKNLKREILNKINSQGISGYNHFPKL